MTVHERSALARFLDPEYRQVWALHRRTGKYVFLDVGQAEARRAEAKREWACPVPGCRVPISTRGKSRRDHFFHLAPSGHGEGESEWHLQAKAMMRQWAEHQPQPVTVREEEEAFDAAAGLNRRADVMVTWPETGRRVAFEVEYKALTPDDWLAKHSEYAAAGIHCVWLLGHLPRYLKQPRQPPDSTDRRPWDRFKWCPLTEAIGKERVPVLFVNPVQRAIATVITGGDYSLEQARRRPLWWQRANAVGPRLADPMPWDFDNQRSWLVVDAIDTCTLDPFVGLITPAMQWVEAQREAVRQAAVEDRATWEAVERRRAEQAGAAEQARRTRGEYRAAQREQERRTWEASDLRRHVLRRFGGALPDFLAVELPTDGGVFADPTHWHCQVLIDLTAHGTESTLTVGDIYRFVSARFRLHDNGGRRSQAICQFLRTLRDAGYLRFQQYPGGAIGAISVVATLDNPPQGRDAATASPGPVTWGSAEPRAASAATDRPKPTYRPPPPEPACPKCGGQSYSTRHWHLCLTPAEKRRHTRRG